jgi:hypothetical protein
MHTLSCNVVNMFHVARPQPSRNFLCRFTGSLGCKGHLPIKHIPGPEGVRGRNSNNELIKEVLGWAPSISLKDGLGKTAPWILEQVMMPEYFCACIFTQDDSLVSGHPLYMRIHIFKNLNIYAISPLSHEEEVVCVPMRVHMCTGHRNTHIHTRENTHLQQHT